MASFTKMYEVTLANSDPSGENNDVQYVSFYERVGAAKKLVAQMQINPHATNDHVLATFAQDVIAGLVDSAFSDAGEPLASNVGTDPYVVGSGVNQK